MFVASTVNVTLSPGVVVLMCGRGIPFVRVEAPGAVAPP